MNLKLSKDEAKQLSDLLGKQYMCDLDPEAARFLYGLHRACKIEAEMEDDDAPPNEWTELVQAVHDATAHPSPVCALQLVSLLEDAAVRLAAMLAK